ncbi:MAG: hypothetical protein JWN14_4240, partial [Chthonomonadales bacterium]|nr:hypothetical protein [Chthonomonadales bacterium]
MSCGINRLWGAVTLTYAVLGAALLSPSTVMGQDNAPPKTAVVRTNGGEAQGVKKQKNLFRDFMGLNVHSVGFKPELYKPVCRLVRDYHPMVWDLDNDTSNPTQFPMTRNKINWLDEYGVWKKTGYNIDVSMQFEQTAPGKWKDMAKDAFAYGQSFAQYFGPSGEHPLVGSAEIGNEPANYSDAEYRTVFENMARGIRQGEPHLPIATCNVVA